MKQSGLPLEELIERRVRAREAKHRRSLEELLNRTHDGIRKSPTDATLYLAAARYNRELGNHFDAIDLLKLGLERCAPSLDLFHATVRALEKCNRTEEAREIALHGAVEAPGDISLTWRAELLLPVFYHSSRHIENARARFDEGLWRLEQRVGHFTGPARYRAAEAIGQHTNVYLAYQGENDRELQTRYGKLTAQIMQANCPQLKVAARVPPAGGRLRVGYVSARFRPMSGIKAFGGWLREHDPEKFELFAYSVGHAADATVERYQCFAQFREFRTLDVVKIGETILQDQLDVLVYLSVGMDRIIGQLAALRLAPVQCAAWDQPVTTGLPTIDYFLTGDSMEPQGAAAQYSEELVRLPGIGMSFEKPAVPEILLTKTRADFGLRDEAVVFSSLQSVFKYLPEQDSVFGQIAGRVPQAQFVFLATNEALAQQLRSRIGAFVPSARLVILQNVSGIDYWNLLRLSDVALDTVAWSGGVSSLEMVACGLPIVTLPGQYMRGRQTAAILRQAGAQSTIAASEQEYIEIAGRLGADSALRKDVSRQLAGGASRLFFDRKPVRDLENFYSEAGRSGREKRSKFFVLNHPA